MEEKIRQRKLDWSVDSAGTGSWHIGEKPDRRSMSIAKQNGIDISGQRARQFDPTDVESFDLILAMDRSNLRHIQQMTKQNNYLPKVHLIMEFAMPGEGIDVPDPYWDDNGFSQVFEMLDIACEKILSRLSADL